MTAGEVKFSEAISSMWSRCLVQLLLHGGEDLCVFLA